MAKSQEETILTKKIKQIIVLGAGVIGSCYGAFLSLKNDVKMIDDETRVNKINNNGITIITDIEKKFNPVAQTHLRRILPNTLVLLTTKAHQSEAALQKIKKLLRTDTIILILQNGLGNEAVVKKILASHTQVIRGIVNSGAWELEPTRFQLVLRETVLKPSPASELISKIFNDAGLPTRISQNFKTELWQKLILNCVVNPLTAILQVRNNQIGIPILAQLRLRIIKECIKVAKAEGIILPPNLSQTLDKTILSYTNFSSMYQDIIQGKKTEIDFLNGRIIELGKKHKIPTPYNEILYNIIKFLELKNATK